MPTTLLHEQWISRRKGSYRSDIPGAIAIFALIAFFTGIVDEDIREQLWRFVWGSLLVALVFGALALWARRALRYHLQVFETPSGLSLRLSGPVSTLEFQSPLRFEHGLFEEHIEAFVASRTAPVLWIQFRDEQGRTLTVRRALGIQHEVPRWPELRFEEDAARVFSGDPASLVRALQSFR